MNDKFIPKEHLEFLLSAFAYSYIISNYEELSKYDYNIQCQIIVKEFIKVINKAFEELDK